MKYLLKNLKAVARGEDLEAGKNELVFDPNGKYKLAELKAVAKANSIEQGNIKMTDLLELIISTFESMDLPEQINVRGLVVAGVESGKSEKILDMNTFGRGIFSYDGAYLITEMFDESYEIKLFKTPVKAGALAGDPEQLTTGSGNHMYPSRMTKDGWFLYSERARDYKTDTGLLIMHAFNVNTGESKRVFPDMEDAHGYGCLSPDGKKVAFYKGTNLETNMDVYVADFPFAE